MTEQHIPEGIREVIDLWNARRMRAVQIADELASIDTQIAEAEQKAKELRASHAERGRELTAVQGAVRRLRRAIEVLCEEEGIAVADLPAETSSSDGQPGQVVFDARHTRGHHLPDPPRQDRPYSGLIGNGHPAHATRPDGEEADGRG